MSSIGAFFDVDRTLVACNTGRLYLEDLRRRGEISFFRGLRALGWLLQYHLSLIDLDKMGARLAQAFRGASEAEFAESCQRWVEDRVLPRLQPKGLRKVQSHLEKGHVVAILSSSPTYVTRPIAHALGIDEVLSTQLEVVGGRFTGNVIPPVCAGRGKVHWAEHLGRRRAVDVGASWFYTDSYTDLPMLERVAHRVIVNPDPLLRRLARRRGWTVENWAEAA